MIADDEKRDDQAVNRVYLGDCIEIMTDRIEERSVDLIFADPPYNLQLENELWRPNQTLVDAVDDEWDRFDSPEDYDEFTRRWLEGCRRVLKDTGTIWVIGSYHNIYRVGKVMADLGFWTLNDVIWVKTNPMPNFSGTRFQNAHETLIWAKKSKDQKRYTFNYHSMKALNEDLQMRSDWEIPLCTGKERIKVNGEKAHSTQKPEALLRRVILSSSNIGDVVLDPFFGTGTTGVVAKRYKRNWIGIEVDERYVELARGRLEGTVPVTLPDEHLITPSKRGLPKVSFGQLLEVGLLEDGQHLFSKSEGQSALICADGTLATDDARGSIHKVGAVVQGKKACNGWDFWYFRDGTGKLVPIEDLRNEYRRAHMNQGSD